MNVLVIGGTGFVGPAIVEERESTFLVGRDARVSVDDFGFMWMELEQGVNR